MNKLLFGTSGIPLSTNPRNTIEGIKQVKKLGLDNMEIEFVRNVNISLEKAPEVRKIKTEQEINLTCHGQYWVNLNSQDKAIVEASKKRIIDACTIADAAGVWSICYHMAYYMKLEKEVVFLNIKNALKDVFKELRDRSINKLWLRPETGGKINQFGDVDELVRLSQEFEQIQPCIDFAHHFARTQGKCNTYADWSRILETIEKGLGREGLDNMHCHMEGIVYGASGEKNHVNLKECTINYQELVKAWKDFKIKGVITCESPNIEEDALLLKNTYKSQF